MGDPLAERFFRDEARAEQAALAVGEQASRADRQVFALRDTESAMRCDAVNDC